MARPLTKDSPDVPARRPAVSIEEQKRSFLRMVSHELRTPLNAVIGFSEILSSELYGPLGAPQYKDYAEMIRQSGLKLLQLVNQILEIARLEGQVLDLDVRREPLDHAIDDVLVLLGEEKSARGVRIVVEDEGRLPPVSADPKGVRTIFQNLLQNAVTFSPDGGTVRVRARRKGEAVEIEVQDEGDGIEPSEIPRILRPFEQGENALTRSTHGAGLGLPICALLASAMGGSLRLRSRPGRGLTACVTLPAA